MRFIDHYRDQIEFITDYEPKGAIHHMVFACQHDPSCRRETATRHMQRREEAGRRGAHARGGRVPRHPRRPRRHRQYATEDYANTILFRLMGEPAFLALDVKLVHIGTYAYQGDLRRALGLTVVDPRPCWHRLRWRPRRP